MNNIKTKPLGKGIFNLICRILLMFALVVSCSESQPSLLFRWNIDLEKLNPTEVVSQLPNLAVKTGRPLLVYFHADWCHNCIDLERLLAESQFSSIIEESWLPVRIDISDSKLWQEPVFQNFGVYGVPALSFVTKDGAIQKRLTLVGASPPKRALRSVLVQLSQ
ncbi:MAG: thioredoxin family protein [Leptonema sp. (in: Bacteria)]|nr:thioredoxin family protein [Leptonema sp. (in: bacteria)]